MVAARLDAFSASASAMAWATRTSTFSSSSFGREGDEEVLGGGWGIGELGSGFGGGEVKGEDFRLAFDGGWAKNEESLVCPMEVCLVSMSLVLPVILDCEPLARTRGEALISTHPSS